MSFPSLAGKTVAVTGATGGIGFAMASRFAQEGASVILGGRNESKLKDALHKIQAVKPWPKLGTPPQHHALHIDVRQLSGWNNLVDRHQIDVLVNCAGESQKSLLVRIGEPAVENMIQCNLLSAIWGCRAVGKQMIPRREGCIINVSSLLAHRAAIGTSIYAATKAGQLGLTTALSQELGTYGIRVNAIVPGYIETDMTQGLRKDDLTAKIPLKRFGTADEVADAAAFLAKNAYANNCILNLDGGLSAV
ncbi:NAD(P)-binding protein [Trichocladium antarcticum]|uniref:NAD(P)-binding protein n=1 Tax=Trichocladium antarcticum TaxID=1450529 RepID=A0AAN6UI81_9PEZI|nr:NAD(P)-binding protein [Trichocladium antarcticum]